MRGESTCQVPGARTALVIGGPRDALVSNLILSRSPDMSGPFYLADGLTIPDEATAGPAAHFWQSLRNHELVVQQCSACGTAQNPAEYLCHACHSSQLEWVRLPTAGQIFSWTR